MENIRPITQKKHILIVDDSEDMRQLLKQILEEEEEYQLYFAENGQEALERAGEIHLDLILMDMSLPGMTGWEAVRLLRQIPETEHMPIIAVTAHVSRSDQDKALTIGCNAHLGKPFDVVNVLDTVALMLDL